MSVSISPEAARQVDWSNWAGTVQCQPQQFCQPQSEDEMVALVKQCRQERRSLRVVGSGHSFTPLVETQDVLVNLDHWQGLLAADRAQLTAVVKAGTKLHQLGELLFEQGMAQVNMGDINLQSVAGAISTGTHGTGEKLTGIAAQVEELTLITGRGERLVCSAQQNTELFKAAQISLGALGVITQVKLKLAPSYKLKYESRRSSLQTCLHDWDRHNAETRNFEFYWFPHSDKVQMKFMNQSDEPSSGGGWLKQANDVVLENGLYWVASHACRLMPSLCPSVSRLSAALIGESQRVDYSHRLFATQRLVRFQEMEYNLPREHFQTVIEEIRALTAKQNYAVHFPIECRTAAADDIWLSPAYQRASAYIAVHMFKGMPWQQYFSEIQDIFLRYDGRPHWGKWHSLRADELAKRYPRWQDFLAMRAELDPEGVFLNPYLRDVFGLKESA